MDLGKKREKGREIARREVNWEDGIAPKKPDFRTGVGAVGWGGEEVAEGGGSGGEGPAVEGGSEAGAGEGAGRGGVRVGDGIVMEVCGGGGEGGYKDRWGGGDVKRGRGGCEGCDVLGEVGEHCVFIILR